MDLISALTTSTRTSMLKHTLRNFTSQAKSSKMSMLSIQVTEWGTAPRAVRSLPPPTPVSSDTLQLRVLAAGLHQVVKSRAAGSHYSSGPLPHTLGVDGVGVDISTGETRYFSALSNASGSFTELVNVKREDTAVLPEGVDVVQAAALMNPVLSSWMALKRRVDFVKYGEKKEWTVLIMGATSMSGRLAVKVARSMGATKVYGAARNEEAMKKLDLDGTILIKENIKETDFSSAANVDVVLDYLYGPYMTAYLTTTNSKTPLTYVCIGSVAGNWADLPSAALRRRDVTLRGSGPGAWTLDGVGKEFGGMLEVLRGLRMDEVKSVKMEDVEEGMAMKEGREVFVNEGATGHKEGLGV